MDLLPLVLLVAAVLTGLWLLLSRRRGVAARVGGALLLAAVVAMSWILEAYSPGDGDSASVAYAPAPDAGDASGDPLPAHPWPPEDPSSLVTLSHYYNFGVGVASLYEVAQTLVASLYRAGYAEVGFYRVPGGLVLVTRLEGIDVQGRPLGAERRYRPPGDRNDFSLPGYIRNLFFAPEGWYRYIAFVVSDKPYTTADRGLDETTALDRLRRGGVALPASYRERPYTPDHRVDALIYEFHKAGSDGAVEIIRPGRLPPENHFANNGLLLALSPWSSGG